MSTETSENAWLSELRAGNAEAAQGLWEKYFDRLVTLAKGRLQGTNTSVADEEDVALSAFKSFCDGVQKGRFPPIQDRDSLWRLLVVITARKAADLANYQKRKKRDAGRLQYDDSVSEHMIDRIVDEAPTPDFAAMVAEEFHARLAMLEDESLQKLALLKLDGYTNDEIAIQLGRSLSTIERRLRLIRRIWKECE